MWTRTEAVPIVTLLTLSGAALFLASCSQVRTFVFDGDVEPGWVVIEDGNPSCEPLERTVFGGVTITVGSSRNICTSSQMPNRNFARYYKRRADGSLAILREQEWIRQTVTTTIDDVELTLLWYGPAGRPIYEPASVAARRYFDQRGAT